MIALARTVLIALLLICVPLAFSQAQTADSGVTTAQFLPQPEKMPAVPGLKWYRSGFDLPLNERKPDGTVVSTTHYFAVEMLVDRLQDVRKELGSLQEARAELVQSQASQEEIDALDGSIQACRAEIKKLEAMSQEELEYQNLQLSALAKVNVAVIHTADADAFLDALQKDNPLFQGAVSIKVGERGIKSPAADFYSAYFKRGNYVVGLYAGSGVMESPDIDLAKCGGETARVIDKLILNPPAVSPQNGGTEPTPSPGPTPTLDGWAAPPNADWDLTPNPCLEAAVLCSEMPKLTPVGVTDLFGSKTARVTLAMKLKPGDSDVSIRVTWLLGDRQVHRSNVSAGLGTTIAITIVPSRADYLKPGVYRAEIKAEGEEVGRLVFRVLGE